jgi:membrane protease subunit (stomatin/prohibitin family)
MGLFNKQRTDGVTYDGQGAERKGFIDRIKYNGEPDELAWKSPYENLSIGAQLVVNQSQEAVFMKGGAIADIFGAGTHTLSANNIPLLQKLINLPFGGKTPFTAEVWYINKTVRRNLPFGTPVPIQLLDPFYKISIPIRSFGNFGVQITDSSAFLQQMVGTLHLFTTKEIIEQFKSLIVRKLSSGISNFITRKKIAVIEISAYLDEISIYVRDAINEEFAQYGVKITNFDVASINFDEENPNVKEILKKHTEGQGEAARLAALRGQADMYQLERQLDIMQTAAGNEGSAGQMMGAGMGLGMGLGVGGTFGQQMGNIAGVMQQQNVQAPPPPPVATVYHVLINNTQYQYDLHSIGQYIQNGQITRDTLVWKAGMVQWAKASDCSELQNLFGTIPPPPPIV